MKLAAAVIASTLAVSQAFSVGPSVQTAQSSSTQLQAVVDRRAMLATITTATVAAAATPLPAFAEYQPKFDDLKQIYYLGMSLDRLIGKFENADTIESGLEGVRMFNKDPNFYPGYAKNYVLKLIKKGGDKDARVGYVRQACTLVGSTETIMSGGMADATAQADAIARIKKAQGLIGKFLEESGVQDEKIAAYVASH